MFNRSRLCEDLVHILVHVVANGHFCLFKILSLESKTYTEVPVLVGLKFGCELLHVLHVLQLLLLVLVQLLLRLPLTLKKVFLDALLVLPLEFVFCCKLVVKRGPRNLKALFF